MKKIGKVFVLILIFASSLLLIAPAPSRTYITNNVSLEINGQFVSAVKECTGGNPYAEVINEPGNQLYFKKHIGQPKYEDITMKVPFSMTRTLLDWISEFLNQNSTRKNGSLVYSDNNGKPIKQIQFYNALIRKIVFPNLDGTSKEPAYIEITISPEYTRIVKADKSKISNPPSKSENKLFIGSNFKFTMDNIQSMRIRKIDSLIVEQIVTEDEIGDARDQVRQLGQVEIADLSIQFQETGSEQFVSWFDDFILKGNNSDSNEKSITIEYLSTDRTKTLLKLKLNNVGVYRMTYNDYEDTVSFYDAELYAESAEIFYENLIGTVK